MRAGVAAVLRGLRRPAVPDAALSGALLAVCLLVNDPWTAAAATGNPVAAWAWWAATALSTVGVTLRRRWPLPMLALCLLSVVVHLAQVPPMVIDAGVLVLLYTVAARRSRGVSLAVLGLLLLLVAGWTAYRQVDQLPALTFRVDPAPGSDQPAAAAGLNRSGAWGEGPDRPSRKARSRCGRRSPPKLTVRWTNSRRSTSTSEPDPTTPRAMNSG